MIDPNYSVKAKRLKLEAIMNEAAMALQELKKTCDHSGKVTYKYCGDSGNYDPGHDSYWIEWRCHDCDKHWITDQDAEGNSELNRLRNAVRVK
jgi:hypothetical protein